LISKAGISRRIGLCGAEGAHYGGGGP
jgi:hypothetical protein